VAGRVQRDAGDRIPARQHVTEESKPYPAGVNVRLTTSNARYAEWHVPHGDADFAAITFSPDSCQ